MVAAAVAVVDKAVVAVVEKDYFEKEVEEECWLMEERTP